MVKAQPPTVEVDGVRPLRTVEASSADEVAGLLADASRQALAVLPVGGTRALTMGNPPQRIDLAIRTTGLNRIVAHSPADLTVTVEAGVTLEELNEVLGLRRQFLPLDVPGGPGHTIGGALASGWTGPLRLRYGAPREYVIGLTVALPDGKLVKSGGQVVKNVSGYDLNKLHLGVMGSMGIITQASLKVFPQPRDDVTVHSRSDNLDQCWRLVEQALALPALPTSLEVARRADGFHIWARLGDTFAANARLAAQLGWERADGSVWQQWQRLRSQTWSRVTLPRAHLRDTLSLIDDDRQWWASPALGTCDLLDLVDLESLSQLRQAAEAKGGSLVLLAAPAATKKALGAWGKPPANLDLMRRLRHAFDPFAIMSPGRYLVDG